MNLREIEERVAALDVSVGRASFIYDLLEAYGFPKASIARLQRGTNNRAKSANECLWRGRIYDRFVDDGEDLHGAIDNASHDPAIRKAKPRFLMVRNVERIVAMDMRTAITLDIPIQALPEHMDFFLPWANIEKTQLETLNYADVKAAEKMARLYDEILKKNPIVVEGDVHRLNIFFSRLLFCFFAEDTGVFPPGAFTNAIASFTNETGEDVDGFLNDLFDVLNTQDADRGKVPDRLRQFGYVNGKLFAERSPAPTFSSKARRVIIECGTLDWSRINPDIFGSMIQAVVHPSQRDTLGMHYTSVDNIMKVLRPLFLDELHEALEEAQGSVRRLKRLLDRISGIKVFDPACGSGNFLVLAYKELRKIEHSALQSILELAPDERGLFSLSRIKLEHFSGIDIDDFAHEIAILSLWLAKHQMNIEFRELFGVDIPLIPLKDTGQVVCGNATRVDWETIFAPNEGEEIYIAGNPPYLGSRNQKVEHKADLKLHHERYKSLDYVCSWIVLAARLVAERVVTAAGLVTTNSVTQGEQVGILWPDILAQGVEIAFAHQSFKWSNEARGKAGVTCVVLGLRATPVENKRLYSDGTFRLVTHIAPNLTDAESVIVTRSSKPIADFMPTMSYGCLLNDHGHLILDELERSQLLLESPSAAEFVKPLAGASEFLKGLQRWCLYIPDDRVAEAVRVPEIARRLDRIRSERARSTEASTRKLAATPHRYYFSCYREEPAVIVPLTTSERRDYIPIGLLPKGTVVTHSANVIYGAEPWVFGLVQSRLHMVWVRSVAGRLKTDYRYSAALVYNTFPAERPSDHDREAITASAFGVIEAREAFPDKTLAELYDPKKMPGGLRAAHTRLDDAVDTLFSKTGFASDVERLKLLQTRYELLTTSAVEIANA